MIGGLRSHWIYTSLEIWNPLSSHEKAPEDLFSDLFVVAEDHLGVNTTSVVYEQIRNDPLFAIDKFFALKGSDFANEMEIAEFLEDAFEVIEDYGITGFGEQYKSLLRAFIAKYNLRYRLDDLFELRFLLPGSFANLYGDLRRINAVSATLTTLMLDFEHAFSQYSRSQSEPDLKTCIHKASNYAEGLASYTNGNPTTRNTLGALCDILTTWPHNEVRDSVKSIYKFCSDYPGIRHGGNPASVRRVLGKEDPVLISILLFAFSGYLTTQIDKNEVLGV